MAHDSSVRWPSVRRPSLRRVEFEGAKVRLLAVSLIALILLSILLTVGSGTLSLAILGRTELGCVIAGGRYQIENPPSCRFKAATGIATSEIAGATAGADETKSERLNSDAADFQQDGIIRIGPGLKVPGGDVSGIDGRGADLSAFSPSNRANGANRAKPLEFPETKAELPEIEAGTPQAGNAFTGERPAADAMIVQVTPETGLVLNQLIAAGMPFTGAPRDKAVVIFFVFEDYQCPHCRVMHESFTQYLAFDNEIAQATQIVHVPVQRLNGLSKVSARLALAGWLKNPDAFSVLLDQLFRIDAPGQIGPAVARAGFSLSELQETSSNPEWDGILESIEHLATGLRVRGTPMTFVWAGRGPVEVVYGSSLPEELLASATRVVAGSREAVASSMSIARPPTPATPEPPSPQE